MVIWCSHFRTFEPFEHLPRVGSISVERITFRDEYYHIGKYRTSEQHALFKYTLSGEGVFRDADGEHRVGRGSGFLCWISDPATAYYYPQDSRVPWEFIYMTVSGGNSRDITRELVRRNGPVFDIDEDSGLISRLKSYQVRGVREKNVRAAWSMEVAMNLFETLAISCDKRVDVTAEQAISARAMKLIESNLHRNINVTEVAAMMGVSREHFSRLFKQETNVSPLDYLRRRKMIFACRILKETTLSIKQIAARMGFDSPEHFSRTFKSVMHMPPRKFREVGVPPHN